MRGFHAGALVCLLALTPAPGQGQPTTTTTTYGCELRLRWEAFDNILDLNSKADDSYHYYRMRSRIWVDAKQGDRVRAYFRLGNEYRWGRGENVAGVRDADGKFSVDNGYVDLAGPPRTNLSLRFGRQDLMYGEGFLIFDGTPADGSGSTYFDALKLTWRDARTTVDLLTAKIDAEAFGTADRDEDLYGLYGTRGPAEAYLLHRIRRKAGTNVAGDIVHPAQRTTALGGRYSHLPETGWQLAAEAAGEAGKYDVKDRRALGGYARGGWTSAGAWRPGVEVAGLYLSGGDPAAKRYDGWDGFYSEWPKYSEGYVYTLYDNTTRIRPDDPGTWTNMTSLWLEGRLAPCNDVKASARCAWIGAPKATGPGGGKVRGVLIAGQVNVTLAPGTQGQLLGEVFDPGSFYASGASRAWYARWQIVTRL